MSTPINIPKKINTKMKCLRCLIFFTHFVAFNIGASAQSLHEPYPEIGKSCPDFVLTDITHYWKQGTSLNELKGKWLILEFWSSNCINSIRSLQKINELQEIFQSEIQFILIAPKTENFKNIKPFYEDLRHKFDLKIPSAYDSLIFERFGIKTVPHVIIIDKKGIIRAITFPKEMAIDKIKRMLNNENVSFEIKASSMISNHR